MAYLRYLIRSSGNKSRSKELQYLLWRGRGGECYEVWGLGREIEELTEDESVRRSRSQDEMMMGFGSGVLTQRSWPVTASSSSTPSATSSCRSRWTTDS